MLDPWVIESERLPSAKLRLFCFPHAGAGAALYRLWPKSLAPQIEVCRIQPPGRESRLREPALTDFSACINAICNALEPLLDVTRFVFFGHSIGALVAFEVARNIRQRLELQPAHLFVSAFRCPQWPLDAPMHNMPDARFVATLRERYGTDAIPEAIDADPELRALFLPLLRADISVFESYHYSEQEPLNCPISAFSGEHDTWIRPAQMIGWEEHSSVSFQSRMVPGNHFFLKTAHAALIDAVRADLAPIL